MNLELLNRVLASLPLPAFVVNAGGTVVGWNPGMERLTGTPASELVGVTNCAAGLPFPGGKRQPLALVALELGRELRRELFVGSRILVEHAAPLRHADAGKGGSSEGVVEVINDATDAAVAEEMLAEVAERYSHLFTNSRDAIVLYDRERVLEANPAATGLLGVTSGDQPGRALVGLLADGTPFDPFPSEDVLDAEVFFDVAGERAWFEASITKFGTIRGTVFTLVARDLRPRLKAELERLRKQKLESIALATGGLAHDFGNYLSVILGFFSLLEWELRHGACGNLGGEAVQALRNARAAADRARELVRKLLLFAKSPTDGFEHVTVNLAEVVGDALALALSGTCVEFHVEVPRGPALVKGDPGQLVQAFHNLAVNAAQAGARHVTVQFDLDGRRGEVVTSFADDGRGIPRSVVPLIFDPYFTTKESGHGLGLSVVHAVLDRHGGTIKVESKEGVGTRFVVRLPVADEPVSAAAAPAEPAGPAGPAPELELARGPRGAGLVGEPRQPPSVLVMDDEEAVRSVLCRMLERAGYETEGASDAGEMLAAYAARADRGRPFDYVLLDLTLRGGGGGVEALRRLLEFDPRAVAVLMSGYLGPGREQDYLDAGFAAVLAKPFVIEDLNRVLASLAPRSREESRGRDHGDGVQ
ncbi:MAG: hypothetical protein Kow0069_30330 [Promethearchaeota archaeon]